MFQSIVFSAIAQSLFLLTEASSGCADGILTVGGKTSSGPSADIKLLSGEQGWCQNSGFPELPEPLVSPGAYLINSYLLVCGFSGNHPCKYTQRGWSTWEDIAGLGAEKDFKMVFSSLVGSVMMISTESETVNGNENHLQHNPVQSAQGQGSITSWMEMIGSPFNLNNRDLENACFSSFQGDLLISGGYKSYPCRQCTNEGSSYEVGKWSVRGSDLETGPPSFEDEVFPDMTEERESHACAEFAGNLVISGGYYYHYSAGPGCPDCPHITFQQKQSAEYYNGFEWKTIANMTVERTSFGLQPMCGMLVALGGVQMEDRDTDGEFLSSVEIIWSVESEWVGQSWMELPEARAYFASIPVTDMECW